MGKKITAALLLSLFFPYIVTLAWTGVKTPVQEEETLNSGRIIWSGSDKRACLDVEEYLIGVLARQIPAEYPLEAVKAQAVIARTYIYSQMGDSMEIQEESLDMDWLKSDQMESLWGSSAFQENVKKLKQAAAETRGMVMKQEGGDYIEPLFCRASAGKTRNGGEAYPYLVSVDASDDKMAEEYLQSTVFTVEEFAEKISGIPGKTAAPAEMISEIQIVEREEGGYVKEIQIGGNLYTGEEVQYALGLASSSMYFEEWEGNIRATTKGIGHGYGLSQFSAGQKAEGGWKAEEILEYFYKNILLIVE